MEERKSVIMTDESDISIIDGVTEKVHSYTVGPIVANGDPIGAVIIFSKEAIISEIGQSGQYCCQFLSETNGTVKVYNFRSSNLS